GGGGGGARGAGVLAPKEEEGDGGRRLGRTPGGGPPAGGDHSAPPMDQIGNQCWQPIGLVFRPAVVYEDIFALDKSALFEALAECETGIAGCCARAASGHPAAAPPSSVMNWRRFH